MGRGKMLITTFMSNLDFGPARRVIAAYSDFRDPAERCQSFVTPLAPAWRKVLRVRWLRSGPKFCESAGSGCTWLETACREYCQAKGLTVSARFIDTAGTRNEFTRMIFEATRDDSTLDFIVFWKLNRQDATNTTPESRCHTTWSDTSPTWNPCPSPKQMWRVTNPTWYPWNWHQTHRWRIT